MNKDYINSFSELFGEVKTMTPEKLQSFMAQTMDHLFKLRVQLSSSDPKEREEALNAASEIQAMLSHQKANLGEGVDVDHSQLSEAELMERMSEGDRELLSHTKEQLEELKTTVTPAQGRQKNKETINLIG